MNTLRYLGGADEIQRPLADACLIANWVSCEWIICDLRWEWKWETQLLGFFPKVEKVIEFILFSKIEYKVLMWTSVLFPQQNFYGTLSEFFSMLYQPNRENRVNQLYDKYMLRVPTLPRRKVCKEKLDKCIHNIVYFKNPAFKLQEHFRKKYEYKLFWFAQKLEVLFFSSRAMMLSLYEQYLETNLFININVSHLWICEQSLQF